MANLYYLTNGAVIIGQPCEEEEAPFEDLEIAAKTACRWCRRQKERGRGPIICNIVRIALGCPMRVIAKTTWFGDKVYLEML